MDTDEHRSEVVLDDNKKKKMKKKMNWMCWKDERRRWTAARSKGETSKAYLDVIKRAAARPNRKLAWRALDDLVIVWAVSQLLSNEESFFFADFAAPSFIPNAYWTPAKEGFIYPTCDGAPCRKSHSPHHTSSR